MSARLVSTVAPPYVRGASSIAWYEQLLLVLLFLAFLGRFYYFVWGFEEHLRPLAPTWVIVLRELPMVGVVVLALAGARTISADTAVRLLGAAFLFISAIAHLPDIGGVEWTQHYLRNMLLPILAACAIGLVMPGGEFWRRAAAAIQVFCVLNSIVSVISWALDISVFEGRVIGLPGDPIANSGISVIGIALAVFHQQGKFRKTVLSLVHFAAFLASLSVTYLPCLLLIPFLWRFRLSVAVALIATVLSLPYIEAIYSSLEESEIPLIVKVLERIDPDSDIHTVEGRIDSYRAMLNLLVNGSLLELVAGDLSGSYFKADALIAGLLVNNGFLGLFGFTLVTFPSLLIAWKEVSTKGALTNLSKAMLFLVLVFLIGGLVNNNLYKYPLNIVCYLGFVYFSHHRQLVYEESSKTCRGHGRGLLLRDSPVLSFT